MRLAYWSREIAGWILILVGLFAFWNAYDMLLNKRIFEAGPVVFMGFIVFRGGIHILKVAVAAQASRLLPEVAPSASRSVTRVTARPVGPTPASAILPGHRAKRTSDERI